MVCTVYDCECGRKSDELDWHCLGLLMTGQPDGCVLLWARCRSSCQLPLAHVFICATITNAVVFELCLTQPESHVVLSSLGDCMGLHGNRQTLIVPLVSTANLLCTLRPSLQAGLDPMASSPPAKAMASTARAQASAESGSVGAAASPPDTAQGGAGGCDDRAGGRTSMVSGHSLAIFIREDVDPGAVVGYFHSICQDHGERATPVRM